jgi:hypothetical protein
MWVSNKICTHSTHYIPAQRCEYKSSERWACYFIKFILCGSINKKARYVCCDLHSKSAAALDVMNVRGYCVLRRLFFKYEKLDLRQAESWGRPQKYNKFKHIISLFMRLHLSSCARTPLLVSHTENISPFIYNAPPPAINKKAQNIFIKVCIHPCCAAFIWNCVPLLTLKIFPRGKIFKVHYFQDVSAPLMLKHAFAIFFKHATI